MSINFTSSDEVFEWLSQFINLEQGQKPKSFRIDRMETLMEMAGHPEKCAPSIHIAGSKGKGSVTGMAAAILTAAGFRAARYMSPHVADIRERLCIGNSYFNEEVYIAAGGELREIAEVRLPAAIKPQSLAAALPLAAELFDNTKEEGADPTYFELLTLYFFLCARLAKCDALVVETGMGGRLDSTNVLDPLVSVITIIELEHTAFLGSTLAAIAGEKAGIIKTGKPLVLAKQNEEALGVFKKTAKEKNCPLLYFPEISEISNLKIHRDGTDFTFAFKAAALESSAGSKAAQQPSLSAPPFAPLALSIPIPGQAQAENAALAIAAVKTAFPQISEDAVRRGLANFSLPARFEKIAAQKEKIPPFIIDGAHTPESLSLTIETFCSLYGKGGILVFGCAADKDAAAMAKIAHEHFTKIIITTPGSFRASYPAQVYEAFAAQAGREKTQLVLNAQEAVRQAITFARTLNQRSRTGMEEERENLPILGTGSFYLAAEIRKIMCTV